MNLSRNMYIIGPRIMFVITHVRITIIGEISEYCINPYGMLALSSRNGRNVTAAMISISLSIFIWI